MLPSFEHLAAYWSAAEVSTNPVVFMNLVGALLLGLCVGYERSYHGRAAGMRTYALVCTASCALTVIAGYPSFWFGGQAVFSSVPPDPTRVIQGVVTGIGFLGAGVIMKEGLNISGLTTAASIWASSAIGVMVGVGFYAAAILLTALAAVCMTWVSRLENWLPSRPAVAVTLLFQPDHVPTEEALQYAAADMGYDVAWGSLHIARRDGKPEWRFVVVAQGRKRSSSLPALAARLANSAGVESFELSHARN